MTTKCKPQGPRCNKFEIWTKMAKLTKPQGPKWQFTLLYGLSNLSCIFFLNLTSYTNKPPYDLWESCYN
ncbi:hypothetical protein Hanom_Chr07g00594561 [Helianthus anomalus]